jgi:hypothetical protein
MSQSIASLVIVSHTGAPSPTSVSHVGDGSTFSTNYVDILPPTSTNYVEGTIIFTPNNSHVTSPTSIHHTGDDSLFLLVTSIILDVSDVNQNSFAGLTKEVTLLVCAWLLLVYQKRGAHPKAFQILKPPWFLLTPLLP